MATVDPDEVRAALAGIAALLQDARLLPDQARVSATKETLKSVMDALPDDAGGLVTTKHWADLSEDDRQSILNKLNDVRNDLTIQVSSPGLFGSRMLMSSDPAPTWVVLLLLVIDRRYRGGPQASRRSLGRRVSCHRNRGAKPAGARDEERL